MKIAILGSGGREHAFTYSISKSNKVEKIYCIPGNAGTSELAENISLDINDFKTIYEFLKNKYGNWIVYDPEFSIKTFLLWALPLILFVFGGLLIIRKVSIK